MEMKKKKLYDVHFSVYNSIVVEAYDEEDAIDQLTNEDIKERVLEGVANGAIDFRAVEEVDEVE